MVKNQTKLLTINTNKGGIPLNVGRQQLPTVAIIATTTVTNTIPPPSASAGRQQQSQQLSTINNFTNSNMKNNNNNNNQSSKRETVVVTTPMKKVQLIAKDDVTANEVICFVFIYLNGCLSVVRIIIVLVC